MTWRVLPALFWLVGPDFWYNHHLHVFGMEFSVYGLPAQVPMAQFAEGTDKSGLWPCAAHARGLQVLITTSLSHKNDCCGSPASEELRPYRSKLARVKMTSWQFARETCFFDKWAGSGLVDTLTKYYEPITKISPTNPPLSPRSQGARTARK